MLTARRKPNIVSFAAGRQCRWSTYVNELPQVSLPARLPLETSDLLLNPCQVFFPLSMAWSNSQKGDSDVLPFGQFNQRIRDPTLPFVYRC